MYINKYTKQPNAVSFSVGGWGGVKSLGDQEKILQIRHISKEK